MSGALAQYPISQPPSGMPSIQPGHQRHLSHLPSSRVLSLRFPIRTSPLLSSILRTPVARYLFRSLLPRTRPLPTPGPRPTGQPSTDRTIHSDHSRSSGKPRNGSLEGTRVPPSGWRLPASLGSHLCRAGAVRALALSLSTPSLNESWLERAMRDSTTSLWSMQALH
jgi:hypothetical protein